MTEQLAAKPSKLDFLRSLLPGSLISVTVHALLLILATVTLRGCQEGVPTDAGGREFREIGLATEPVDTAAGTDRGPETAEIPEPPTPPTDRPDPITKDAVPTEAPSAAELLNQTPLKAETQASTSGSSVLPDIIGPGEPIAGLPMSGSTQLIRPSSTAGGGAAGSPTPGPGETSFMNIVDGGRSFVYVVDVSSSMSEGQRLELAKSQLKGSLHRLQPSQKFQVLFYNETTVQMRLRRRPADDLYTATAVQLQLADDEIDRVQPSGGTEHRTPLLHALRLEPEVVYFLTDGDQPELSTQGKDSDLAQLGRANRSGARIHVIEFGSGGRESRDVSWLQLLAHRFGGRYQYIHVGSRRQN